MTPPIILPKILRDKELTLALHRLKQSDIKSIRYGDNRTLIFLKKRVKNKPKQELIPSSKYANFLIANHVVLLPVYEDVHDKAMVSLFKQLFPGREIIPINALRLIEEGGSIHCSTMQVVYT